MVHAVLYVCYGFCSWLLLFILSIELIHVQLEWKLGTISLPVRPIPFLVHVLWTNSLLG